MRTAGVREIKDRFSEFLRYVKAGEEILVTDRGEVVARLGPPGTLFEQSEYPGVEILIRQGRAKRGAPNRPGLYAPTGAPGITREDFEKLLDDEREDRV